MGKGPRHVRHCDTTACVLVLLTTRQCPLDCPSEEWGSVVQAPVRYSQLGCMKTAHSAPFRQSWGVAGNCNLPSPIDSWLSTIVRLSVTHPPTFFLYVFRFEISSGPGTTTYYYTIVHSGESGGLVPHASCPGTHQGVSRALPDILFLWMA